MLPLELAEIPATSPTLAGIMRGCLLRAGLSRAVGSSRFILGNPKAWLGTAYHEVLEKIAAANHAGETTEEAVERLWNHAISMLQQRVDAHPLDRRFGLPETWPGYHVARASVLLRAKELDVESRPGVSASRKVCIGGDAPSIREQELTACEGKLVGRPDVIRDREVVDYKSGALIEHDDATHTEVLKASYIRQLRIYGYLIKEELGWWPVRGVLLPLAGAAVEVALDPTECIQESTEAVTLLDAYNAKVRAKTAPEGFASPSPQSCRWCPFKLVCSAFWRVASPDWSGQLDAGAVEGVINMAPSTIHLGAAVGIELEIQAGSEARDRAQIAPLNTSVHQVVSVLAAGERVRLVGLRVRPDGGLAPTQRTVLERTQDVPAIAVKKIDRSQ